jgi:hypothetical protein
MKSISMMMMMTIIPLGHLMAIISVASHKMWIKKKNIYISVVQLRAITSSAYEMCVESINNTNFISTWTFFLSFFNLFQVNFVVLRNWGSRNVHLSWRTNSIAKRSRPSDDDCSNHLGNMIGGFFLKQNFGIPNNAELQMKRVNWMNSTIV